MTRILTLCITLCIALMALAASADPIVTSSAFTPARPESDAIPAAWTVPAGSPWHGTNADGYSGHHAILYSTRAPGPVEPVTQTVALPADTTLVLTGALKTDGTLRPVARLRYAGENGAELARIVGAERAGRWERYAAEFNTGAGGEAVVELWADLQHIQRPDRAGRPGSIAVDDVQILTQQEAEALRADAGVVTYENLARDKRYSLFPPPGYAHCTESGDRTQLTDGQYTVGYFWTQKSTIGWSRVRVITITLDLGQDYPIRGLSFNTAAGVAGVHWPESISVLVSSDGRAYYPLGDLVELSAGKSTPPSGYAVQRFHTDQLQAHGRYVKVEIVPVGTCLFVDEIEVYRGEDAWLGLALPGKAVNYPPEYYEDNVFDAAWKRRIGMDLELVRSRVEATELVPDLRTRLNAELTDADETVRELPGIDPSGFRSVLPLNPVHARVYAVQAALWMVQGRQPIVAWKANPWEYIHPAELPDPSPPAEVTIAAMKGETRAGALNLTNCTEEPLTVHLAFADLPGGPTPDYLTVHQAEWTDTREGLAVAAALPEVPATEGSYSVLLPAGMTRQVWFSFKPVGLDAGAHRGSLTITGATAEALRVPVTLRVFDIDFPAQPRLRVGGWEYTNATLYGVTAANRDALIEHLQSRYVDSPWATSGVLAYPEFDDAGRIAKEPATEPLDTWIARWPQARSYCVFRNVGDSIGDTKIGDPLFAPKVGAWIKFWVTHCRTLGIEPHQLTLLLVDEPGSREEDETIIAWSRAIKAAEPEVVIFDDGTRPPERIQPDIISAVDIICPHRPALFDPERNVPELARQQVEAGKRLYFYSCMGPARLLDPYAYHRLQAWSAFEYGGEGSFFWAFGSSSGDSWNEYASASTAYTPLFMSADSVTPGKHMEAIRQSVGDFEYLCMLRDRVADLEANQPNHPLLAQARALLTDAPQRVLGAPGATALKWEDEKDTTIADGVAIEIGEMLERLK